MKERATTTDRASLLLQDAEQRLARRDLSGALQAFYRAEQLGADAHTCCGGRWTTAMLQGDLAAAWCECDTLRARNAPDPHRLWNGKTVHGARLIVRSLHGLGDAVQMLRYAPRLRQMAASVVYEVPPRLQPLAPYFVDVFDVITWGDDAPRNPPAWDLQIEVMELAYLFRTQPAELPLTTCYLKLPAAKTQRIAARMGCASRPQIGIVWAGGEWNPHRSIPLDLLAPILEQAGFEYWSLQGGPAADFANRGAMQDGVARCGDGLLNLAATIVNLDLVITVDTLAAHLAGALGKPVWVMLQYAADWRWMVSREDSPWYPTMRLFRQPTEGNWKSVIANVAEALHTYGH